jgi:hypothetical protein
MSLLTLSYTRGMAEGHPSSGRLVIAVFMVWSIDVLCLKGNPGWPGSFKPARLIQEQTILLPDF